MCTYIHKDIYMHMCADTLMHVTHDTCKHIRFLEQLELATEQVTGVVVSQETEGTGRKSGHWGNLFPEDQARIQAKLGWDLTETQKRSQEVTSTHTSMSTLGESGTG